MNTYCLYIHTLSVWYEVHTYSAFIFFVYSIEFEICFYDSVLGHRVKYLMHYILCYEMHHISYRRLQV